ncbi:hypothetical protein LAV_00060 [Sphingobium phage Lacusarx]|uniref:Uncharacterized protein n=1 Tax=Sphingobium phage Lacusarx TaxID=1980139 RepID=A0A1W6DWS2_9CAUD|nr:hypothetical protein FDH44_gp060 [Sphingobium phage Lacusarx]ARK07460.1 hypothetical protein LAV_00060 [Sphingobium phage Lacusarx]
MNGKADYYQECFEISMEEAGCWHLVEQMTKEQRQEVGEGIAGGVENEGMAFYTPPSSDRYNQIERDWKAKYDRLQAEFDRYRETSGKTLGRILRQHSDTHVFMDDDGSVYRSGGRTTQIA